MDVNKISAGYLVDPKLKGTFTASPTLSVAYPYPQAGGSFPIFYIGYSKINDANMCEAGQEPHGQDYLTLPLVATLIRGADIGILLSSRVYRAEYSIVTVVRVP